MPITNLLRVVIPESAIVRLHTPSVSSNVFSITLLLVLPYQILPAPGSFVTSGSRLTRGSSTMGRLLERRRCPWTPCLPVSQSYTLFLGLTRPASVDEGECFAVGLDDRSLQPQVDNVNVKHVCTYNYAVMYHPKSSTFKLYNPKCRRKKEKKKSKASCAHAKQRKKVHH